MDVIGALGNFFNGKKPNEIFIRTRFFSVALFTNEFSVYRPTVLLSKTLRKIPSETLEGDTGTAHAFHSFAYKR